MSLVDKIQLSEKQQLLIEKVGVFYEKSGLTPAMARIVGLLLVSHVEALTFDQIRDLLNLSKSATSNALNALLTIEYIEYITKIGDRKRYFKNRLPAWKSTIETKLNGMLYLGNLLDEVLESRTATTTEYNQDLADLIAFLRFVQKEMSGLMEKWEKEKGVK